MKRRDALKNIGLSFGAITLSSTMVGLIQSCSKGTIWEPQFFSLDEAEIIEKTLNVMLPTTDNIPGAIDLNLAQFIDGYTAVISDENEQKRVKKELGVYINSTLTSSSKQKVSKLTAKDIDQRLAYYLKADASQQQSWEKEANTTSDDSLNFSFLKFLRSRAIYAFKISQEIGVEVLAYAPVPGKQQGCVDLQETTGGKAWSL